MSITSQPSEIVCSHCGTLNDVSSHYCLSCGMALPRLAPVVTSPSASSEVDSPLSEATTTEPRKRDTGPLLAPVAAPDDGSYYRFSRRREASIAAPPTENPYSLPLPAPSEPAAPESPYHYAATTAQQPAVYQQSAPATQRNVGPLIIGGVVLLLVGLIAVGAFSLRGGTANLFTPPTATPLAAEDLLARAAARIDGVQTLHYHMLGEFSNVGSSEHYSLTLEGDVRFPDSYTMSSSAGDIIVIGPDAWSRVPGGERWLEGSARQAASSTTNPAALARFIRYNHAPVVESDYISGTQHLYRLNFTIDTIALAAGEGDQSASASLSGTKAAAAAVIGADDYVLHELVLSIMDAQNTGAKIRIEFSDFDVPVTIAPPAGSTP